MELTLPGELLIKNKEDFEHLFRSYYSVLCAYANTFLKDVDTSEEVVQEMMFKLWTNRGNIRIESSVKSYLFRSVRNASLNVIKHVAIREEHKRFVEQSNASEERFEDQVVFSELHEKIREAIDRLPMERKRIFIMSRYDGKTYQQIADELKLSIKTVENQMGKALKTLREELSEYLPWLILFFVDFFKQN